MILTAGDIARQLSDMFRESGIEHHRAFVATNGDDPEWPIWYAEFLQPGVNNLLGTGWTKSELVYLLLLSEKERTAQKAGTSWPELYAAVFIREAESVKEVV